MDAFFFHPKIVHLPMALSILMPLVAGGLLLAWHRKWLPTHSWVIVVALQALLVGSGIVALRTGENEEDRVERVVSERVIHEHEEAAEAFVWGSGVVLGAMLLGLATAKGKAGLPLAAIATVGTLVVLGLGYRTGQEGGELVYQHGAASAYLNLDDSAPRQPSGPERSTHNDSDDHGSEDDDSSGSR